MLWHCRRPLSHLSADALAAQVNSVPHQDCAFLSKRNTSVVTVRSKGHFYGLAAWVHGHGASWRVHPSASPPCALQQWACAKLVLVHPHQQPRREAQECRHRRAARDPGIRCSGGNRFHRRRLQRHSLGYQRKHSVRLVFHNTPMPCPAEGTPLWGPGSTSWEVYRLLWFLEGSRDRERVAHKNFPAKPNRRPRHEFRGTWAKTQRPNTQPLSWFSALQRGQESPRWCLAQQRSSRSYRVGVLHLSPRCATSVSSWCFHLDCLSGGGWRDRMRQLRVSR